MGLLHEWVYTRAEKTRWGSHGLIHGWDYRRVGLLTEFYGKKRERQEGEGGGALGVAASEQKHLGQFRHWFKSRHAHLRLWIVSVQNVTKLTMNPSVLWWQIRLRCYYLWLSSWQPPQGSKSGCAALLSFKFLVLLWQFEVNIWTSKCSNGWVNGALMMQTRPDDCTGVDERSWWAKMSVISSWLQWCYNCDVMFI